MPDKQRALVLQGGGALGAYELGAFKALYEKLSDGQLFDIVAGTSIGAINAAILVSKFRKNKSWKDSLEALEGFWDHVGSVPDIDYQIRYWDELHGQYPNRASKKAAWRYHSAEYYQTYGARNVFSRPEMKLDEKFFDNGTIPNNIWFRYDNQELRRSVEGFADFPISTSPDAGEPRLLVIAVDIAEGAPVAFDSYEQGRGGVRLEHVMASASIPVFFDYEVLDGTKYWDGAVLSNTPLREVVSKHKTFWERKLGIKDITSGEFLERVWNGNEQSLKVPDLDAFIISVWPSKELSVPSDHDGLEDRLNDIRYSDKTEYDEKVATFVTDYIDLVWQLIQSGKASGVPQNIMKEILERFAKSVQRTGDTRKYIDLVKGRFRLDKVIRIERRDGEESVSRKFADFSEVAIKKLVDEGRANALEILARD